MTSSSSSSSDDSTNASNASSDSSSSDSSEETYVVQDGENLSSIAADHGMSVAELANLNDLDVSSNVVTGQTLKLK